ncbi:MAG: L-threonylcarbamoyladenylate synthase [Brumimicrobium sp.]|nr:L-threonylcarbamoyladenylate synthase [Brumimicrobium sp.]
MITKDLDLAKKVLLSGELIAIPTETVYGLAGNAFDPAVVRKIFTLKKRPFYNPLIVHIKSIDYLSKVATDIPETAMKLAQEFWPGSLTLVLKKQPEVPELVTAGKETVAVRIPNHPLTLELLNKLDFPLAAPSANPFGSISPTSAEHVSAYFGDELGLILDGGNCERGLESTILGFEEDNPVLYRLGSLSLEEIEDRIGSLSLKIHSDKNKPEAPGMLSKHYAPSTETYFPDDLDAFLKQTENKNIGLILFSKAYRDFPRENQEILSETGDLNEAARNLYSAMHRLDKRNFDMIVAQRFPDRGLGKTINDKLRRAATRST